MSHPKEGSGETGVSTSGARLMKVKQEVGEKMKKDEKKKKAKETIGARVAKRAKKTDGSSEIAPQGFHPPSLLKSQEVVNLMVQAHGRKELAKACNPDETPETAPEGWFCIHEKYISKCHLIFPLSTLILDLLDHYQLALSQLCPSVIRVINGFITRSKEEGVDVGLTDLMSLFLIKESSSKDGGSGTYYLPCRPKLDIADPCKLSGSARFPERYKASFLDPVSVADLEVSEGNSVVSISTEASTSETEKTQPSRMPLKPSFRSRGRPSKATNTSRGSDKSQGGSFLSSVKEVLDEGTSNPVKDVTPTEPQVQDVAPLSDAPMEEAEVQFAKDPPEIEPPRNKRSRTDQVDRPSRSSSSSSRGGTVGWSFTHSKPGSILDDSWGLATLMRHMKRTGCFLPSINNLTNRDEYAEIDHFMGQLARAVNRAQLKFEDAMHNAPNAG
ncbi:uncharacterized protein LOC108833870 [Raphanus sativus]|uniref:Uncharacterized protein LOC108833870 n=1 Tax=Raphanus sativus TaxID=3726 RepID=A0A6J0LSE2_RAPSA|nr:uncharacterized protein LOC108833870 [Raphanus sativus]